MQAAPAWVNVRVIPATESVSVRGLLDGFAEYVKLTVPLPVPLVVPSVTQFGAVALVAVHAQPVCATTVTLLLPAAAPRLRLVAERAYVQPVGNSNWLETVAAAGAAGPDGRHARFVGAAGQRPRGHLRREVDADLAVALEARACRG